MTAVQTQVALATEERRSHDWSAGQIAVSHRGPRKKAVVVHAGARDAYQLAIALSEKDALQALVTDLFWSQQGSWGKLWNALLPHRIRTALQRRSATSLTAAQVRTSFVAGLAGLMLDRARFLPFSVRRTLTRLADAKLGKTAGELAKRTDAALISYSYYAYDAFRAFGKGGILFQMHPHPATMRRILSEELEMHPDCAESLNKEWELSLPEEDFRHLVQETRMASHFLVASSFTRNSLIEHGAAPASIDVIPYGVDLLRFTPATKRKEVDAPLKLLFVGRINQRKGVKYLLEALRQLDTKRVTLTICGRVLDDLVMFAPFGEQIEIRPSVNATDLVEAYQSADLFVFPSVGEGFGQVLLEALACGLPILSTTHTAAPDIIEDGIQGFIVEPRRPDLLAKRIAWAMAHPEQLVQMGRSARKRAEQLTWQRFRSDTAMSIDTFLSKETSATEGEVS